MAIISAQAVCVSSQKETQKNGVAHRRGGVVHAVAPAGGAAAARPAPARAAARCAARHSSSKRFSSVSASAAYI